MNNFRPGQLTGVSAVDKTFCLAKLISKLVESGVTGPLNFVNNGTISLPEFLKIFGYEPKKVVDYQPPKPSITFSTAKLSECTGRETSKLAEALKKLKFDCENELFITN